MFRFIIIPISIKNIDFYAFSACLRVTKINYAGTKEQWNKIVIAEGNDCLKEAIIVYGA